MKVMGILKKVLFGTIFLILFVFSLYQTNNISLPWEEGLSFDLNYLVSLAINLLVTIGPILGASLLFSVFVTLSQDWKIILPVIILASLSCFVSFNSPNFISISPSGFVLAIGSFAVLTLTSVMLINKLKNYLTFQPTLLLSSGVKTLATLLILLISVGYFFNIQAEIKQKGFKLPDSLIDSSINLFTQSEAMNQINPCAVLNNQLEQQKITKTQVEQLLKNPQLAQKSGITPEQLNLIRDCSSGNGLQAGNEYLNTQVKDQAKQMIQSYIDPFINWIPLLLTLIYYLNLTFFASILLLFVSPFIWFIFLILEKSGFIHFVTEMREVKKMVV